MELINVMKIKLFLVKFKEEIKYENIKYDWDGGHCYSYIDHSIPIMKEMYELEQLVSKDQYNHFLDRTNDWLYSNDECPPCQIHIDKDKKVSSCCGCHDDREYDDALDVVSQLEYYCKENPETKIEWLVTREDI